MARLPNRLLSGEELEQLASELAGWSVGPRIQRSFEFESFPAAMAFMLRVSYVAERLDHHPAWRNVHRRVDVELWSHDLGGVSLLCASLARAMDHAALGSSDPHFE